MKRSMSVDSAFKVLELGFQWGCGKSQDVMNDNLTEENVLEAFRAEINILGKFVLFLVKVKFLTFFISRI